MERIARRWLWMWLAAAVLVLADGTPVLAGNGDFEQGPRGWRVVVRDSSARDLPRVADSINLPDPPGATPGRSHAAVLGNAPETPAAAANPSLMYQRLVIDNDSTRSRGVLAFDARAWICGSDVAAVVVTTSRGTHAWRIDPDHDGAANVRRVVSFPGSGTAVVEFMLFTPGTAAVRSVLVIDNVATYGTGDHVATIGMVPVLPAVLPRPSTTGATSAPLGIGEAFDDCDGNNVPDGVEICRAPSRDANGDGRLDSCRAPRRVNWKLMLMGLLILIPTLMRLGARQRRAAESSIRRRRKSR